MDEEFYSSLDRLVEFGLGDAVATQMVGSMNQAMNDMAVPGAQMPAKNDAIALGEKPMSAMRISIASDHAGFEQKQALAEYLCACGHAVVDEGPQSDDRVDYPDYAKLVACDIADGRTDYGVLVCGTGIGMAIAANKVAGARAANCITAQFAQLAREHNDANVITLSGRFVSLEDNKRILDTFLATPFGGGRHGDRVAKISSLEQEGCKQDER